MNYEKQLCKQTQEQPAYIKSEQLLLMQRASLCRYERSTNTLNLMPLFFEIARKVSSSVDSVLSKYANIQESSFYCASDAELAAIVAGMFRSVRALPLCIRQELRTDLNSRFSVIPSRTTYDLIYYLFEEKAQEEPLPAELLNRIVKELHAEAQWEVMSHCGGSVIVDTSVEGEVTLEEKCTYEPIPAPAELPALELVETPGAHTIDELAEFSKKPKTELVKAVMFQAHGRLIFVAIRGDLECSQEKLRHVLGYVDNSTEIELASPELLEKHGLVPGFSGLVGLKRAGEATIIVDESCKDVHLGVCGGNKEGYHYFNYNLKRDTKKIAKYIKFADVAENQKKVKGAIIAEVAACNDFAPDILGNDSKPIKSQLYKITFRMIDAIATLIQKKSIDGVYIMNLLKNDKKVSLVIPELMKIYGMTRVVADNRPKANFGVKKDTAKLSLFSHVIITSNKTDDDTVMVDDVPVKIAELSEYIKRQEDSL